jgi:hypothetical protein
MTYREMWMDVIECDRGQSYEKRERESEGVGYGAGESGDRRSALRDP